MTKHVLLIAALLAPAAAQAASSTLAVNGNADPYLAGQPNGTNCCGGDAAPAQSPAQVSGTLIPGGILTFSATGGFNYAGGLPATSPDGDNDGAGNYTGRFDMPADYGTGISGPQGVNTDALLGVFLTDAAPGGAAPAQLVYGPNDLGSATFSPGIGQIFFIGDGLTGIGTGAVQQFVVPTGATRLFLGSADGSGWYNNSGTVSVTVNGLGDAGGVPEPATWAMMLGGFGMLGFAARARRRSAVPA